jgi:hypothetical protein
MNPVSSAFASSYFVCALLASIAVVLRTSHPLSSGQRLLSGALLWPLVLVYLAGMHRSAGIDFDTYSAAYDETGQPIPDQGYSALTWLAKQAGIDFPAFLFLQGIFTLAAMWIAARQKNADPIVVLAVYLLHLAVVRDMSQSRIGLAIAIYLIGQTRERALPKTVLYLLAISVHITAAVVILVWALASTSARWRPSRRVIFVYIPLAALSAFGVGLLDLLSFVDPRIEIYLSWDDAAYGAPLESFGALGRSILIFIVYLAAQRRFKQSVFVPYMTTELAGAAILIGFSQFSIFAARLSNVAISMYPIGLGIVALAYQQVPPSRRTMMTAMTLKSAVALAVVALVLRPGSLDALLEVVPTVFETAYRWD